MEVFDGRGQARVEVSLQDATVEVARTVGWWQGHRVQVQQGERGSYLLSGKIDRSQRAPVGVYHVEDNGLFHAKVMSPDVVTKLMTTVDSIIPLAAGSSWVQEIGAYADLVDGRTVPLQGLQPVVTRDSSPHGAYQATDGRLFDASAVDALRWRRAVALSDGRPVHVWAYVDGDAWLTGVPQSLPGVLPVVNSTDVYPSSWRGMWAAPHDVESLFVYDRRWSPSPPASLPQGSYGIPVAAEDADSRRAAAGLHLTRNSPTLSRGVGDPVVHLWEDTVEDAADVVSVATTARFRDAEVSLVRPYDAWRSWDEVLVRGTKKPPKAWTLGDGYVVVPSRVPGGDWIATVRSSDLQDLQTNVV
ncbi:hypothetical protein ACPEEZ_01530 [Frigoribacterium sp. 2-23]|uniref:hypothetical protein n=1 Tax=Frigoribacterium sp. 2-23 TaxID=3415006 RepID=UPI003C700728